MLTRRRNRWWSSGSHLCLTWTKHTFDMVKQQISYVLENMCSSVFPQQLELYGENNVHLKQKMVISELLVFVKDGRGHIDGDRWRQHYKRAGFENL